MINPEICPDCEGENIDIYETKRAFETIKEIRGCNDCNSSFRVNYAITHMDIL